MAAKLSDSSDGLPGRPDPELVLPCKSTRNHEMPLRADFASSGLPLAPTGFIPVERCFCTTQPHKRNPPRPPAFLPSLPDGRLGRRASLPSAGNDIRRQRMRRPGGGCGGASVVQKHRSIGARPMGASKLPSSQQAQMDPKQHYSNLRKQVLVSCPRTTLHNFVSRKGGGGQA